MTSRRSLLLLGTAALSPWLYAQDSTAAHAGDISGKWHFMLDTEGGPRTSEAEFKLKGTSVSGRYDKSTDVKGTFADGKLDLAIPINSEEAGPGVLKLTGKLTDVLSGNWSFQSYTGSFKATRVK